MQNSQTVENNEPDFRELLDRITSARFFPLGLEANVSARMDADTSLKKQIHLAQHRDSLNKAIKQLPEAISAEIRHNPHPSNDVFEALVKINQSRARQEVMKTFDPSEPEGIPYQDPTQVQVHADQDDTWTYNP